MKSVLRKEIRFTMAHESCKSQIAVLEMNGQSVPQSMREGSNTARRQCSAWNVELSAIRRAKILASRDARNLAILFSNSSPGSEKLKQNRRHSLIKSRLTDLNNFIRKRVTAKSNDFTSLLFNGQHSKPYNIDWQTFTLN